MHRLSNVMNAMVRRGPRPGSFEAYGIAVACVLAATLIRLLIDMVAPSSIYFATFVPALLIAALIGGLAAGATATLLGGLIAWWMFFEPRFTWAVAEKNHFIGIALYLFAGALIVWTASQYRLLLTKIDEEEKYRRIVVDELSHRVKNKLATIYAILRHELRGQPEIWDSVSGRLQALSAADDFIGRDPDAGVELKMLLDMEVEPFGVERFTCSGPPARLFGKLPTVLALVFHELTTNAAKYGALLKPEGHIHIVWGKRDEAFELAWTESGGPEVLAPRRRSFGSHLIERSLDTFGGQARLEFAPEGVICRISLPGAQVQLDDDRPAAH
jgi:two-component sensor histidine kinase